MNLVLGRLLRDNRRSNEIQLTGTAIMERISIPQLAKVIDQTEVIAVKGFIPDLETLTPLQGEITVSHRGNYLQAATQVETIVTLTCDRCLQQFNHRLICQVSELICLQESAQAEPSKPGLEVEVPLEQLVESLPRSGYFDPQDWLYQQLCLALPQRQLCDPDCPGIAQADLEGSAAPVDLRWANLQALKNSL
jgi:uncharacterized protein